jgi:hypothetical protein
MDAHSTCIQIVLAAEPACAYFGGAARMHAHSTHIKIVLLAELSVVYSHFGAAISQTDPVHTLEARAFRLHLIFQQFFLARAC